MSTVSADAPSAPPAPGVPAGYAPRPFTPRRGLSNGHVMTLVAWARRRAFPALPPADVRRIRVAPHTEVVAECFWQRDRRQCPTLLALHGLEGSTSVHYMRGLADEAWRAGWNAVLLNQRGCGGTEHLARSLYHSGLTDDPRAVIRDLAAREGLGRFGVVGYSLGGNLAVKLAGELPETPDVPVDAVVAVCPTIDLAWCVRTIERRANLPYHFNFVRHLKARMRRTHAHWPGAFDLSRLGHIRTIRAFDDEYTAPHHGFGDAANYYYRASAMRVVDRILIPTLMLAAADDPVVPAAQFREPAVTGNPYILAHVIARGGHCGFISDDAAVEHRYWAESEAMRFLVAAMPGATRGAS